MAPKQSSQKTGAKAKRAACPAAEEPAAKRPKGMLGALADTIDQAESLSDSCRAMLLAGLSTSFETPADARHEHQAAFVCWVGEVVTEVQDTLRAGLAAAEEGLSAAEQTKGELEAKTADARATLVQRESVTKVKEAELASRSEAVQAAKTKLREAQEAQLKGDASLIEAQKEKETLESTLKGGIHFLKDPEVYRAEAVEGHLLELLPLAKQLGLDESLLTALPAASKSLPGSRGSFDSMVIDQLAASLTKRVASLADVISTGAGDASKRAAAVSSAAQQLEDASGAQQTAATELVEAQGEQGRAAEAVVAAEEAQGEHVTAHSAALAARDRKADELQGFEGYNMECYSVLRDKVAPATQAGA